MSAIEMIEQASEEGLLLAVSASGGISVRGEQAVIDCWLPALRRNKAEIVAVLQAGANAWSRTDWQEYFDERAGIAEFDGGLPRDEAEARAFTCCVGEWLRRNPIRSASGLCAYCGRTGGLLLPNLTDYSISDPGHTWLHPECSPVWHQERRQNAVAALGEIGVTNPTEFTDDFGKKRTA